MQSAHFPDYRAVLDRLAARGLLYPCFCSRADIARATEAPQSSAFGPDGASVYPGLCRALSDDERAARIAAGAHYALRLDMALACQHGLTFEEEGEGRLRCHPECFGDVVLARKDIPASYHLCVTHDDALQGVTLVTRGVDLKPATQLHRLLQTLMGWPAPRYAHHIVLTDASGRRLAKRDLAATLRDLRAQGVTPAEIRARVDRLIHVNATPSP
jgi:glutamyl-Q tRNA(Asp) synthetase